MDKFATVMETRKPRVVYWKNIPSPYSVERFNLIAERGNIDLEVWFNEVREPDRSWDVDESTWKFRGRYIPGITSFGKKLHLPLTEIYQARPDLLVTLYYEPSFALGSLSARSLASRTLYAVMPTFDSWSERTWWRELAKHFLFRAVDGAQVSGAEAVALTQKYGLPVTRSYVVTQSINVAHYSRARVTSPDMIKQRRENLGLQGCVFIYVGRLWKGKGLDYLLKAYAEVRMKAPDVSLLLIGDGVDEARYQAMAQELPGVIFTGYIQAQDMPEFYALGDVFVFPTLGDPYGHVIGEAMAAGLPAISTETAGEIRGRISDGQDGFIVPAGDITALANRMIQLAENPTLRRRFAAQAFLRVDSISHDYYARDFETMVERTLSTPPRRSMMSYIARGLGWGLLALSGLWSRSPAPFAGRGVIDDS